MTDRTTGFATLECGHQVEDLASVLETGRTWCHICQQTLEVTSWR